MLFTLAGAQRVKLHNIEKSDEDYVHHPISPPYANFFPLSDSAGVLRYAHIDTVFLRDAFIVNDSLCLVSYFGDTLCIDNAIGIATNDLNFFADPLSQTLPQITHDMNSNNLLINEVDTFKFNNGSSGEFGIEEFIVMIRNMGFKMYGALGNSWTWAFGGSDYNLMPETDEGRFIIQDENATDVILMDPTTEDLLLPQIPFQEKLDTPYYMLGIGNYEDTYGRVHGVDSATLRYFLGIGGDAPFVNIGDEDQIPFVDGTDNDFEYDDNFVFVGDTSLEIDNQIIVNGALGLTPTSVSILNGAITFEGALEDAGSVREIMRIKPNQVSEGNPDFIFSTHNAAFDGARHDNRFNMGWNVVGGTTDIPGIGGIDIWFEDHFPFSSTDHKTEFGVSVYDSTDYEYRPLFGNFDKWTGNYSDWFLNYQVGYSNWADPRTVQLGEGNFFQVRTESDTAGMTMTLGSPRSLGSKRVEFYWHDVINQLQVTPYGTSNTTFNASGFPYAQFDKLKATPTGNAALSLAGWDSENRFTSITWPNAADSISTYLADYFEQDSVFSGDSTLICIVTSSMDTICADTSFYDEENNLYCVVDEGDTTCVGFGGGLTTYYANNSALTSNRTVQMADHWSWWRNGFRSIVKIDPDSSEASLSVYNKPENDVPALSLIGSIDDTRDLLIDLNSVTQSGFMRDYRFGIDVSEGAFRFSETNQFNDFYQSYYGAQDSMIFHKGVKFDGKVWDEDGDIGSTGDVLTKQADGTVNWEAGSGEALWFRFDEHSIYNEEDSVGIGIDMPEAQLHVLSDFGYDGDVTFASTAIFQSPDDYNTIDFKGTEFHTFNFIETDGSGSGILQYDLSPAGSAIDESLLFGVNSSSTVAGIAAYTNDDWGGSKGTTGITGGFHFQDFDGYEDSTTGDTLKQQASVVYVEGTDSDLSLPEIAIGWGNQTVNLGTFYVISNVTDGTLTIHPFDDQLIDGVNTAVDIDTQKAIILIATFLNDANEYTWMTVGLRDRAGTSGGSDADWFESGNTPPNSITDEMYHTGDVHVGDATMSGLGRLNVTGTLGIDVSASSIGVLSVSSGAHAFDGVRTEASTNTVLKVLELNRLTSGTAASGIGLSIESILENSTGSSEVATSIVSKWTDATTNSEVSEFSILQQNAGTQETQLTLAGTGQLTLNNYTGTNFSGASTDSVLVVNATTGAVNKRHAGLFGGDGTGFTQEQVEDIVGAMTTSNTETLISVDYQDSDGTIDFAVSGTTAQFNTALSDGDFATLAGTETLTNKRVNKRVTTLTDGANIAINSDNMDIGIVTLGGNRTLDNPTGTPVDGQMLEVRFRQDGTGSRTISYGSAYRFGTDITGTTLTTTASKTDYVLFQYNSTDTKWDCVSFVKGY